MLLLPDTIGMQVGSAPDLTYIPDWTLTCSMACLQVGLPLMDGVAGPAGAPRPAPEEPGREGNITLPEDRVTPTASGRWPMTVQVGINRCRLGRGEEGLERPSLGGGDCGACMCSVVEGQGSAGSTS
jgi:hypothetical protein